MRDLVLRSETARFLVADGWDYLRTYAVRNLGRLAGLRDRPRATRRRPSAFAAHLPAARR